MVFHTCIYWALIRLPLLVTFSIALFPYYSTAFAAFCYTIFIHRCNVFTYYSFYITIVPFSFSSTASLYIPQINIQLQTCSLTVYISFFMLTIITGMTGSSNHSQLLVDMGLANFLVT
jgi:hypothetical protein